MLFCLCCSACVVSCLCFVGISVLLERFVIFVGVSVLDLLVLFCLCCLVSVLFCCCCQFCWSDLSFLLEMSRIVGVVLLVLSLHLLVLLSVGVVSGSHVVCWCCLCLVCLILGFVGLCFVRILFLFCFSPSRSLLVSLTLLISFLVSLNLISLSLLCLIVKPSLSMSWCRHVVRPAAARR